MNSLTKKSNAKKSKEQQEIDTAVNNYDAAIGVTRTRFDEFPLSQKTQRGLSEAGYTSLTDIQREALLVCLRGHDVLGAAKTGSGKTLAFLIPVLECLWRNLWTPSVDGLGGLVISPTRELALQTFNVLQSIGRQHGFSLALVVGGRASESWEREKRHLARANIAVCTPGRLLQHMDENAQFSCDSLKIFVVDEADRILDLGFEQQVNAVLDNLPVERQTLHFLGDAD